MGLRITNCIATPNSVIVFFSAPVDKSSNSNGAQNNNNYTIECPIGNDLGGHFGPPLSDPSGSFVTIPLNPPATIPVRRGFWLSVRVRNVSVSGNNNDHLPSGIGHDTDNETNTIATQVNGDSTAIVEETRAVEDAVSFPILTEEVGFAPSPVARISGAFPAPAPGAAPLGQIVTNALNDVLGWKIKTGDAKGFVGALNASFACKEMEGRTECTWTPRSYAVQTDLSGGITGAQASIYSRAKDALDKAVPLLEGLSALDPEAVTQDVTALKAIVNGQLTELVKELGLLGGPRVSRVNQYFGLLIGLTSSSPAGAFPDLPVSGLRLSTTDPDLIEGTLGNLRDDLGLNFTTQDFVNSVADEEDLSNYRILSDYVTSLAQSWLDNLRFFGLNDSAQKKFFGTQLVLLQRQLSVVAESVDEVRFTFDSVFIGPAERQTLLLNFASDPSIFLEDLLTWIQGFASDEGPKLIQDGGKFGVRNTFLPVALQLQRLVNDVLDSNGTNNGLPPGFHTARVKRALQELNGELNVLVNLAQPISHIITPLPEFGLPPTAPLTITGVSPTTLIIPGNPLLTIIGTGFTPNAKVTLAPSNAPATKVLAASRVTPSPEYAVAIFDGSSLSAGNWTVEVAIDGRSASHDGLIITNTSLIAPLKIHEVSPSFVSTGGGELFGDLLFSITGTGFTPNTKISLAPRTGAEVPAKNTSVVVSSEFAVAFFDSAIFNSADLLGEWKLLVRVDSQQDTFSITVSG